jgi:tetratricopeptide (TPR) repeat protein
MNKNIIKSIVLASVLMSSSEAFVQAAINGNNYNSCYSAGEKAFAVSDYVSAAENFAQALKYKPDDLRSHLKYGQTLFSLNRYDESSSHLQTVLQNSPNNIIARIYLAENYLQLNKEDLAKEQLEWVLKVQPGHPKANELYNKLTKGADSESSVETLYSENENKCEVSDKESVGESAKEIDSGKILELKYSSEGVNTSQVPVSDTSILNKSDNSMTFTPYVAGSKKVSEKKVEEKPVMPAAKKDITNTDMASFFKIAKDSYIVNLEKARYEIEKGDLTAATKTIETADKLARNNKNSRSILEVQIFKSLVYIYNCEFQKFGKHLMTLKPALSTESYQSFLDIYSRADGLKNEDDLRRLSAGVAAGAGHHAVVVSLLKPVFEKNTKDFLLYSMLSEAQFNCFDYEGAGETLKKFVESNPESSEANFNMARFCLTADYNSELARSYANKAYELNPEDARCGVIIALTDYSEGKIEEGIKRVKELMPTLKDSSMKAICQRLISDGEKASKDSSKNFMTMLALPGTKHSNPSVFRFVGEDELKMGSYFSAMDNFTKAGEGAEVGRVYLGLASALTSANELEMASVAAGYGLKSINDEMAKGKNIARASLYKALYYCERKEKEEAVASIDLGLNCKDLDISTYNKLVTLYNSMKL